MQGISFKVSANGKQVIDLSVSTPFKCNGGCGGVESPSGGVARVSKNGRFKATLKLTGPGSSKSIGSDTVTGTFLRHGKAKGTVTSHFNSGGAGETVSWTAAASASASSGYRATDARCTPRISTIAPFAALVRPTVVIRGTCLGTLHPTAGTDTRYLRISDLTRSFNGCSSRDRPEEDLLTCKIASWDDRKIVFGGFTGETAYAVAPGDEISIQVWNAQTGAGPAVCSLRAVRTAKQGRVTHCRA